MDMTTPEDLAVALHRFGLERDRFRTALAYALGLVLADLDALEHLELSGALTQRELGERLLLTSGAVTMLVDRLERAGVVSRETHPSDRRMTLVRLAEDPQLPVVPELDAYHEAVQKAAASVPTRTRAQVITFLGSATEHAAAATDVMRAARRSQGTATTDSGGLSVPPPTGLEDPA